MSSQPQIGRLLASLLAATAVGTVLAAREAAAQSLRPAIQGDGPLAPIKPAGRPAAQARHCRHRARASRCLPPARRAGGLAQLRRIRRPTATTCRTGVRSAPRDGDLATAVGRIDGEVDGITEEAEAYRTPDGTDPVRWDARDEADRDAFERPPAGYDPELYQAEVSRDPRPAAGAALPVRAVAAARHQARQLHRAAGGRDRRGLARQCVSRAAGSGRPGARLPPHAAAQVRLAGACPRVQGRRRPQLLRRVPDRERPRLCIRGARPARHHAAHQCRGAARHRGRAGGAGHAGGAAPRARARRRGHATGRCRAQPPLQPARHPVARHARRARRTTT